MDRRDVLRLTAAVVAASATGAAQSQDGPGPRGAAPAAGPGPAPGATAAPGIVFDAFGGNLQWCRSPQELGKAVVDMGLSSIDVTIGGAGANVDAGRVRQDLPALVAALKGMGIAVTSATCAMSGVDTPGAEAMLAAIAAAGIRSYGWSGLVATPGRTLRQQTAALKPGVEKLARLNEKYKLKGLYQPRPGMVGAQLFDILAVLDGLDPARVGIRYDSGFLLQASPQNMAAQLRLAGPYIGGVAISDALVSLDLPTWDQGRFTGRPEQLTAPDGGGDNTGNAGGNPDVLGGGGRPLPYRYHGVPVGTGMVDLMLLARTLKEIGFNGPAECQILFPLGGAENGGTAITLPRQEVIGRLKRDWIVASQAFEVPFGLKVLKPSFLERGAAPRRPAGPGGAGGPGGPDGPPGGPG